jgi:hypothetical protein
MTFMGTSCQDAKYRTFIRRTRETVHEHDEATVVATERPFDAILLTVQMSTPRIVLRVSLAEDAAEYIRHAREETLTAIRAHVHPDVTAPIPHAVYLLARLDGRDEPVGLAEACFLEQHYGTYERVPYHDVADIPSLCPFPQLAGIRTVYADPAFRLHHALYLKLILGQAHIFRSLGARAAMATTDAADARLARLYDKTGGKRLGEVSLESISEHALAVYLFDLDHLLRHPMTPRMLRDLEMDSSILATVRGRRAVIDH